MFCAGITSITTALLDIKEEKIEKTMTVEKFIERLK
jgi:hypothetical protein